MPKGKRGPCDPVQRERVEKKAEALRRNVRQLAEDQGLTIRELAEKADISVRSLYNTLGSPEETKGPIYPSFETLVLLAYALGTTEAQLLGEPKPEPSRRRRPPGRRGDVASFVSREEASHLLGLGMDEFDAYLKPFVDDGDVRVLAKGRLLHRGDINRLSRAFSG